MNEKLQAIAERLIHRHPAQKFNIEIQSSQESYLPRKEVTLDIQTKMPDGTPLELNSLYPLLMKEYFPMQMTDKQIY